MNALILIGTAAKDRALSCLYIGLDGVELEAAAKKAAASGQFQAISKVVHPSHVPLAVNDIETKANKTPELIRQKPLEVKLAAPKSGDPLAKINDQAEKLRKEREAKIANPLAGEKGGGKLVHGGPTLEEWMAKGEKPEDYPPSGYAEKDSPALRLYKQGNKNNPKPDPAQGKAEDKK